ncbi:MAG: DUF1819 family protein [Lachnospiraceae bacterium]|jgi:Putative inner membrane protein (DUF1819).|nr:DUF1819 family protein [Lachnospiraceae bacterium]
MEKEYSAGAVKFSFWFMEFKKVVRLLTEGKSYQEIKEVVENENLFAAATPARARQIYSTVTARIKSLDDSFYPIFLKGDLSTQKLFALTAALTHDRLFFDFVYEVIREKIIIGSNEYADRDIRIFFQNKQLQDEKVAKWTDETLNRLGRSYKTMLYEAGVTDKANGTRKILRPILDREMEQWLMAHHMELILKALTGVR